MYNSVDAALRDVYRFGALRIEPQNNTAQICDWVETKGVRRGGYGLTQHEWHANARMIQNRVERILNDLELAAIECEYGKVDLYHIVDLTKHVTKLDSGINTLLCDNMLENIFTGFPKNTDIMDKYNISKATFWRQRGRIKAPNLSLIHI